MAPRRESAVCVLGGGLWGAVLSQQLAQNGENVRLWEFIPELAHKLSQSRRHGNIPGFRLDSTVMVSSDLNLSVAGADTLVFALPSRHMAATARQLRDIAKNASAAVNVSKGLEPETLATMGDVIAREIPTLRGKVWTLSGPSFAREVARGVKTDVVLAGPGGGAGAELKRKFSGGALRVTSSADRRGVELCGSLKNALAIGAGILDGQRAGDNAKATWIVDSAADMARVVSACGGKAATVYGQAGLGDLIATSTSLESRNRTFGEKIGSGTTPEQALKEISTVVEGVDAARAAHELCRRKKINAPSFQAVYHAVSGGSARRGAAAIGR